MVAMRIVGCGLHVTGLTIVLVTLSSVLGSLSYSQPLESTPQERPRQQDPRSRDRHSQVNTNRPASVNAATPVPPHMGDMPSVEDVYSKVKGSDPVDTAARQVGALRQLSGIVRALSAGGDLGNSVTPEEQQLSAKYISASQEVDRRGLALVASSSTTTVGPNAPAPTWFRARMNYDTEAYRDELLGLFSPRLKAIYQSRFGTFAARKAGFREQAAAAEKADRDRKAEWALERQRADEAAAG